MSADSKAAAIGDTVTIHYTGRLVDGTEFDSSRGAEPLKVTLGQGETIAGFENAVLGMVPGEQKSVTIPCDEAYGERNEEMTQTLPRTVIPDEIELEVGMVLTARSPEGQTVNFSVARFDDEEVIVDGNHPLAGKDLVFDLELVAVA
ncbi:MAG: peptidylprolyl isomerase [Thiohalocapsa sp.]|jgi:peptidylprolyl isomerase|uniref:FKBP-type peptidyl-prolyl cis-trans isomerase n=1 Tax=Thiohalocapsa sp. TaxID=2497641 RepID=UPI0025E8A8F5|nr:peptidylprolyl isomerase [Thiohalocapsa sp.]MCG6940568.1 peptidylprolyl isomerase [Thiohalocapsa sp.]